MQTSPSLSLARVLHMYGDHTRLLTDMGIPLLKLTRCIYLAEVHFRLIRTRLDTLSALLFQKLNLKPALLFQKLNTPLTLSNLHPTILDHHTRYTIYEFKRLTP